MSRTQPAFQTVKAQTIANVSAVEIAGRVLLIEGSPGSGKSSLALALIDRGAVLVGDDAVQVERQGDAIIASPPPNISGLVEIRNVGLVEMPVSRGRIALILRLDPAAPRFPLEPATRELCGLVLPVLPFSAGNANDALRAEFALREHGLAFPEPDEIE